MRMHDVEQGSAEWYALRLGIPTASNFEKIVTPTGKLSAQARKYALRLVAEKLLNRTLDSLDHVEWVEHGRATEPEAVRLYEFQQEAETRPAGFVTTDDGRIGASPDRLIVGARAGLEVKCPSPAVHVGYIVDGPGNDYRPQVQGQMLVAELERVDFWSYHAEMPPVLVRIWRDEAFIAQLRDALVAFCDMKDEMLAKVSEAGYFAERRSLLMPQDAAYAEAEGR